MIIIQKEHLTRYRTCPKYLERYKGAGRLVMLYLVPDRNNYFYHIVPTLLFLDSHVKARAAKAALCDWPVPAAWAGRFLAGHKLLANRAVIERIVTNHKCLEERPLTLALLQYYDIDLKLELALAELAGVGDAS
ncbi:MAG: hypothetical protein QXS54_10985 [Candidatus Methanomethylicaceae archaeon]